jgi:TRAP-type C4-dicarboxylate transport system permease small subunit
MKSVLFAIERCTTALAMWGACAMLSAAAFIALYQVITRFVFEAPAEWSEVSVRITLIWMVFLAVPMALRQGSMVCVDLLYRKSNRHVRRVLDLLILISSLVLMAFILWYGADYSWRTRFQTISGLEALTVEWAYLAMPVGSAFSLLAILGQWFDPKRNDLETAL